MKLTRTLIAGIALTLLPPAARAQNGCVNSPEGPTAVLALIGATAAALSALRNRRRKP